MSKASATIISTVHNYLDGDVKIVVEQVSFQLHMNILSLASEVFKSMFTLGSSRSKKIPEIPLENETIESFQNLLSFIYPTRNLRISWENVDDMLRLADRYEVLSLHDRASEFLEYNFKIDPIRALLMADEYSLRKTYKESSKLVLEYETYCSTLIAHPETLLGTMFKDSNKGLLRPQNGNEYFFDRNSKAFHYILEYYRTAILVTRQEIIEEMKYFQIPFVSHQKMLDVIDYANCLDEFIIALEDSIIEFCKNYGKVLFITFRCWDVLRNNRNVELYNTVPRNEDLKKYLKPFQYSGYRILEIFNEEISARIENRFPGIKCVTVKHDEILDEDDISIYILKISVTHKTDSSRIGGGNGDGSDDDVVDKQNILENSNILKRKADWNVG
nr:1218_t:CDS:2 [Entrophospora candida]